MRKNIILCSLLFAFVFSFSFGFHAVLNAGGDPGTGIGQPCNTKIDVNNCCDIDPEAGKKGICVPIGPDDEDVICECTCIHVQYPTCDGPYGCQYDRCPIGGGS